MSNGAVCYLPDCGITVGGTVLPPFGNPAGGFGGQVGGGGYPTAFPRTIPQTAPAPARAPRPPILGGPRTRPPAPASAAVATPPAPAEQVVVPEVLSAVPVVAPVVESALVTGEELTRQLISQGELVPGGGLSELDRLLQGEFVPGSGSVAGGAVTEAQGLLASLLSRSLGGLGMLLYSGDVGLPASIESALVQSQLAPPPPPPPELTYVAPIALPDTPGLVDIALGGLTDLAGSLPEIVGTAARIPAPVLAPQLYGLPAYEPGNYPLPGVGTLTAPKPRAAPKTSPLASPVPQPLVAGLTHFSPSNPPSPLTKPAAATSPNVGGQPATSADCQCQSKGKKKSKKKHQRNVCHRGTYVEKRSGLIKFKREQIPCQ